MKYHFPYFLLNTFFINLSLWGIVFKFYPLKQTDRRLSMFILKRSKIESLCLKIAVEPCRMVLVDGRKAGCFGAITLCHRKMWIIVGRTAGSSKRFRNILFLNLLRRPYGDLVMESQYTYAHLAGYWDFMINKVK